MKNILFILLICLLLASCQGENEQGALINETTESTMIHVDKVGDKTSNGREEIFELVDGEESQINIADDYKSRRTLHSVKLIRLEDISEEEKNIFRFLYPKGNLLKIEVSIENLSEKKSIHATFGTLLYSLDKKEEGGPVDIERDVPSEILNKWGILDTREYIDPGEVRKGIVYIDIYSNLREEYKLIFSPLREPSIWTIRKKN